MSKQDKAPAAQAEKTEKSISKRTLILVIVAAVVVVGIMAGVLVWALTREQEESFSDEFFDPMAQTGFLPDMSAEEIQEELNRVVEEGMMNLNIAARVVFETGASQGRINIQNSEANHYIQKVTLTLDGTNEVMYESGGIKPGQYIQFITLSRDLEPGTYDMTATFTAYTQEERQIVGSAATKVEVIVLK